MHDLHVRDVMSPSVVVVTADCSYQHVVDVITEFGVSGIPVVSDDDRVIGVISEADLLPKLRPAATGPAAHKAAARTAAELMSSPAVTVAAAGSVSSAAALMEQHRLKRLPVLDDETGTLIGIVTRGDLLRHALRSDQAIERAIMDELLQHGLWLDPTGITVDVHDGVVTLSGTTDRRSDALLAAELAAALDGVVTVVDTVTWRIEDEPFRHRRILDARLR